MEMISGKMRNLKALKKFPYIPRSGDCIFYFSHVIQDSQCYYYFCELENLKENGYKPICQ